jgi:hypothetical protein
MEFLMVLSARDANAEFPLSGISRFVLVSRRCAYVEPNKTRLMCSIKTIGIGFATPFGRRSSKQHATG